MMLLTRFTIVLLAFGMSAASAVPSETDGLLTTALHFVKECGDKSIFLCMKVSDWQNVCCAFLSQMIAHKGLISLGRQCDVNLFRRSELCTT